MKFIVLFEDAPDAAPDIRQVYMQRHLDFLESQSPRIEAAGPLDDPDNQGRNGLWIVEADSKDEIEDLIRKDPFWPTGLRQSYSIIAWKQVFAVATRTPVSS